MCSVVGLLSSVTEVKRCEEGKNVCLQKSDKQFNEVHENHERHRKNSSSDSGCRVGSVITNDEDQKGQRQNSGSPARASRGRRLRAARARARRRHRARPRRIVPSASPRRDLRKSIRPPRSRRRPRCSSAVEATSRRDDLGVREHFATRPRRRRRKRTRCRRACGECQISGRFVRFAFGTIICPVNSSLSDCV